MVLTFGPMGQLAFDPNLVLEILVGLAIAIVILIFGYFVGALVGFIVRKILEKTKLEVWLEKTGRINALGGVKPTKLVGALMKWWIFIAFLAPAATFVRLETISEMLVRLAIWLPHLLAGIVIIFVGLVVADFAADNIAKVKKLKGIKLISQFVRVLIIIYFLTIALQEIGVRVVLAETTLLIIVAGVVLAFAIAFGVGFGYALRKHADKILTNMSKKL